MLVSLVLVLPQVVVALTIMYYVWLRLDDNGSVAIVAAAAHASSIHFQPSEGPMGTDDTMNVAADAQVHSGQRSYQ
jgi:hypothetical protein